MRHKTPGATASRCLACKLSERKVKNIYICKSPARELGAKLGRKMNEVTQTVSMVSFGEL